MGAVIGFLIVVVAVGMAFLIGNAVAYHHRPEPVKVECPAETDWTGYDKDVVVYCTTR